MKKSIILGLSALLVTPALAEVTVHGTIRDAFTQQPLAGVSVQAFNNAKVTTMTDSLGQYQITLPDYVSSIRVKRVGYNAQQIPVGKAQGEVNANLYSDAFKDNIGLGQSSQQILSASVSDLSSDISVDDQISTSLGGQLRSISRGGVPGMGAYMLLNGINSLNANAQPLVVVDGVIYDMQYDRTTLHDGFYNNILSNIAVDDIASVSILRNGTAIYGAKGSNGVILIETKRSHSYNTKIDVNISGRFEQTPTLPDMMNASEYRTYVSEMLGTTNTKLRDFKFLREDPNYYYYKVYHNDTDWTKETYREAYSQHYSINVQGGDDIADYNISLGYTQADAALKCNDFSRFNLRINSDVRLANRLSVRLDASYSDISRDMRDDGAPEDIDGASIVAPGFLSLIKSPFLSPYQYDNQGHLSTFLSQADDYLDKILSTSNQKEGSLANPSSILHYGEARNKNSYGNRMITLGITPKADLGHNLILSDCFSFVLNNTDEGYYIPVNGIPSFYIEGAGTVTNILQSASSHQYLTSNDLRLSWKYKKEGHLVNVMGGWRYSLNRYQLNGLRGYTSGNDKTPDMNSSLSYKSTQGVTEKVAKLTYYAQGAYSFCDKYYLDAAISMEADTRFGKDADQSIQMFDVAWGFFPSVSGSWVVTNEDWFPQMDWLNYLRVNAGWDMTGNDNIDINAARTYFQSVKLFDRVCGYAVGGIGNTKIKWETTKRVTGGYEANLLNNRLSVSFNAYKGWTSDLLSLQSLPGLIGIDQNWCNGGALENTGFDFSVQGKVFNNRDWHWQLGLSAGHYKNEITQLPDGDIYTDVYGGTVASMVGNPVGLFYGYKTDGVFSTTQEADAAGLYIADRTGAKTYFEAGDMKFVDQDGNKEINDNDRVVIGDPNPTVYGNFSSHLQWKKLALDVVFNYCLGNDVYNYQRSLLEAGSRFHNQTTALRARWSSEGQETSIPRISYQDPMGNGRFSDRWIEDGSYLRLKNVTLSYKWDFNYRFLQGVTVWGSAQNLFTLTNYLGSDPEFSASNNILYQGVDCGMLSSSRNFSVGVKINL